jgi:hypothetical protein
MAQQQGAEAEHRTRYKGKTTIMKHKEKKTLTKIKNPQHKCK